MTVQEAFELIVSHTFTVVASGERDILLINADEPDDSDMWREPEGEWWIWLGQTHSAILTPKQMLSGRFDDDNGNSPLDSLTDADWKELIEMLKTAVVGDVKVAITEQEWRESHKNYALCGNCGETEDGQFHLISDFLCLGCASDIYEQGDETNIHWAYAEEIMERSND